MTELVQARNAFDEARRTAVAQIDQKRSEIEDAQAELLELQTGLLPAAEVAARISAWIDNQRDLFAARHLMAPLIQAGQERQPCELFRLNTRSDTHIYSADVGGLLCFLLGDEIKARLVEAAEAFDLPDGPTSVERPALIRELELRIRDLEDEEEQLIVAAHAAGFNVARHPDASPAAILEWQGQ